MDFELVESWCDELEKVAKRKQILDTCAAKAKEAKQEERAKRFFIRARLVDDSEKPGESLSTVLKRKIGVIELDDIRRDLREDYEELLENGNKVDTWQELESFVISNQVEN